MIRAVTRPRILLVPELSEVLWGRIEPLLSEWAEVATYDAPGVGTQQGTEGLDAEAIAKRGLAEIDRRGWDRCFVVADGYALEPAARLADTRSNAVQGLALGHAHLAIRREGPEPTVNAELAGAIQQMVKVDFRSFVRALTQLTQGAVDDELADRLMERLDQRVAVEYARALVGSRVSIAPFLKRYGGPLLLVEHEDCLFWTDSGYEEATAAFPDAETASVADTPSTSPDFVKKLRLFCERVADEDERGAANG